MSNTSDQAGWPAYETWDTAALLICHRMLGAHIDELQRKQHYITTLLVARREANDYPG